MRRYTNNIFTDSSGKAFNFETAEFRTENGNIYSFLPKLKPEEKQKDFVGSPNDYITYFAENSKVTLGGGLTLTRLGISGKQAKSGEITIE